MSDFEQRNLAIIAEVMNELGVKDIEELPAEIRKLRAIYNDVASQLNTANHKLGQIAQLASRPTPRALDECHSCGAKLTPNNPWCQNCGTHQ